MSASSREKVCDLFIQCIQVLYEAVLDVLRAVYAGELTLESPKVLFGGEVDVVLPYVREALGLENSKAGGATGKAAEVAAWEEKSNEHGVVRPPSPEADGDRGASERVRRLQERRVKMANVRKKRYGLMDELVVKIAPKEVKWADEQKEGAEGGEKEQMLGGTTTVSVFDTDRVAKFSYLCLGLTKLLERSQRLVDSSDLLGLLRQIRPNLIGNVLN